MPVQTVSTGLRPLGGGSRNFLSGSPCSRRSRTARGSSRQGFFGSNGTCSASVRSAALRRISVRRVPSFQGFTAPSLSESDSSGTASASMKRRVRPRPPQVGHAPAGWLWERCRGVSGSCTAPQWEQARWSESGISFQAEPTSANARARPRPSRKASSSESAIRLRWSGPVTVRSTTTSSFRGSLPVSSPWASSSVATVAPTRTRENPRRPRSASVCIRAEGRSSATGASSITRVPAGNASSSSRLSSKERLRTGCPSAVQRREPDASHSGRAWSAISVSVATVDRGFGLAPVRWPMAITGDSPRMKSTSGRGADSSRPRALAERDSRYWRLPSACRVSKAREDLPEPLTPVITVN